MITMTRELTAKLKELNELAKTRDDAWQISWEQGEVLASAALAHKAKLIVEVGTSYGFSGLWWLAGLSVTDGKLHTVDISDKKFNSSKATFKEAGVGDRVVNHLGDAINVLSGMPGDLDLVFLDADKPNVQAYFDILWPKLRVGGAVLTDNVLSHKEEMADYVQGSRDRQDAHSVTIPIRSGMSWTIKLA